MPAAVMEQTVKINAPNGAVNLRNPLYSYQFQTFPFTDPDFQGQEISQFNGTKRCTDAAEGSDGVDHPEIINSFLGDHAKRLKDYVYAVFTQSPNFVDMASTYAKGPSFENPHNIVHQDIGGGPLWSKTGHMKPVAWSAFDPILYVAPSPHACLSMP